MKIGMKCYIHINLKSYSIRELSSVDTDNI